MKKIIILSGSILLAVVIGLVAYMTVSNYIKASGPAEGEKAYVMFNEKLFETNSSCAEGAFQNIQQSQGFVKIDTVIKSAVKSDKTPIKNLSTNFSLFVKKELYTSENKPDELYIKTAVNNEIRYYLFTPVAGGTEGV